MTVMACIDDQPVEYGEVEPLTVLVCGSRGMKDYPLVAEFLGRDLDYPLDIKIISGGASGPDTFAIEWAKEMGYQYIVFEPDWDKYGKSAGFIRNKEMIDVGKPDLVIAFWDGQSKGTKHIIEYAIKNKISLNIYVDYNVGN